MQSGYSSTSANQGLDQEEEAKRNSRQAEFKSTHQRTTCNIREVLEGAVTPDVSRFVVACQYRLRQLVLNRMVDRCSDDGTCPSDSDGEHWAYSNPVERKLVLEESLGSNGQRKPMTTAASEVDSEQTASSVDMDIDLQNAIQRFQRYCSVYSDSPSSSRASKQSTKYLCSGDEPPNDGQTSDLEMHPKEPCVVDATGRGRLSSLTLLGVDGDVGEKNRKLVIDRDSVARLGRFETTASDQPAIQCYLSSVAADPFPSRSGRISHSVPIDMTLIRHTITVSTNSASAPAQRQQPAANQQSSVYYIRPTTTHCRQAIASRSRVEERQYPVSVSSEDIERLLKRPYFDKDAEEPIERCSVDDNLSEQYADSWHSSILGMQSPSCSVGSSGVRSSGQYRSTPSVQAHEYSRQRAEERDQSRSSRRQKYKAKMEKAKREFLENRGSVSDLFKSREDFAKKFKISQEEMDRRMRDVEPARGPYLQHLSRSSNLHITAHDVPAKYQAPRSRYDRLHREMVERAERMWANYERRKAHSRLNLYARTRGFSTGFLEAAVDDEYDEGSEPQSPGRYFTANETDLDLVQQGGVEESHRRSSITSKDRLPQEQHRARSADFLLSRANREQAEPPENQLRRVMGAPADRKDYDEDDELLDLKLSEHELRFRKSIEKLHLPDWYLQSKYAGEKVQLSPTEDEGGSRSALAHHHQRQWSSPAAVKPTLHTRHSQPWTYGQPSRLARPYSSMRERSRPGTDFDIPVDFFDKYKTEIEELRKSRSELNQQQRIGKVDFSQRRIPPPKVPAPVRPASLRPPVGSAVHVPVATVKPTKIEYTETYTLQKKVVTVNSQSSAFSTFTREEFDLPPVVPREPKPQARTHAGAVPSVTSAREPVKDDGRSARAGYFVSSPPASWNVPKQRDSVVVDVLESAVSPRTDRSTGGPGFSNLTLEEALDGLLALADAPRRLGNLEESLDSKDAPRIRPTTPTSFYRPAVYVENDRLMERCAHAPNLCRRLLQSEVVWVRCNSCGRTEEMNSARGRYVSCRHCYTYYCSYGCRSDDWPEHKFCCNYARVNTVCKEVIIRVKNDMEAQKHMSMVAQRGYLNRGRGSVNLRFLQLEVANRYIAQGWPAIAQDNQCLSYLTITDLVEMGKSADLAATCRQYNPTEKFILSVSIMVEIDREPRTPLFGASAFFQNNRRASPPAKGYQSSTVINSQSLPPSRRLRQMLPVLERQTSASSLLKNVLRSLENIAPGSPDIDSSPSYLEPFDRANRTRHTVTSGRQVSQRHTSNNWSSPDHGKLAFASEVDETEV